MTRVKIRVLRWLQHRIWDLDSRVGRTLWRLEEPAWKIAYAKRWGLDLPEEAQR